ncbi:MAG: hypothetical protein U0X39_13650 [Bacteroidales bacterium]
MVKKDLIMGIAFMAMALIVLACEDEDFGGGGASSHNTGKDCMGCHSDFKLAGSVYNQALSSAYAGATIKITSQADGAGTVLATLTSDNTGNFHTGSAINFGTGVFVSVKGSSGSVKYMNSAITKGACNSCHGKTTSKIWAE